MDSGETRRQELLGYDERTETWYIQGHGAGRLLLTRQSLQRLVQLYNSIHKGNPLELLEQRDLRRLQEDRHRWSVVLRDLNLLLDRRTKTRPTNRLRRLLGKLFARRRS
jgi:hypothetical protein